MQQFDHCITHAADTILGSAHSDLGLASKLDRWFIPLGDWAIITRWPEVGDYYALVSYLWFCPPAMYFTLHHVG